MKYIGVIYYWFIILDKILDKHMEVIMNKKVVTCLSAIFLLLLPLLFLVISSQAEKNKEQKVSLEQKQLGAH